MSNNKKTNSCSLLGVGFVTFIIFLILKLTNTIDWSWVWVTCPLWSVPLISLAFLSIGFGITMLALLITVLSKKK